MRWGPRARPAPGGDPFTPAEGGGATCLFRISGRNAHHSTILLFHHSASNKPNFGPGRRKDKCRVDNELRRMGHGRGCEKTKPIPLLRISDCGLGTEPHGNICLRPAAAGLHGPGVQTNPIFGSRPGRPWYSWTLAPCYGTRCGVSPPAQGMTLLRTRTSAQTNPIWDTARRTTSALQQRRYGKLGLQDATEKQSQFPAGHGMGKGRQGCRWRGAVVQTRRPRQKSQSRLSTRVSERIPRIGLADPDFCRARQTNPIR